MRRFELPTDMYKTLSRYGLNAAELEGLLLYEFQSGEYLSREGRPLDCLLFITDGRCKVSVTASTGKRLLISFYSVGEIIGILELMTDWVAAADTQATTLVRCIALPLKANITHLKANNAFLNYYGADLSTMLVKSSKNSATNILYPLETRLCSYIAMTHENGCFRDNLSEVNELLGTSYRHLLRTLQRLCDDGVLKKRTGGYDIADLGALEQLAQGYYKP